ncbi:phosphonate C-P lyase system protein PhnH [uncultured Cohaesibacter sp.]|uniref:phosphonate C-P lyase system protein PhnH n=1 Tax=uncultured Cohaesibacter sp. TaxID=1002546 RepID=UPI0029C6578E|nr:phosphonate C-P lyase system protein PhnH [uncultured Cohaesibacter sp.]
MPLSSQSPQVRAVNATAMQGGPGEPVLQSQRIFRALMEAMARPGRVMPLATDTLPPMPLTPLSATVLFTLADANTPVWLDEGLMSEPTVADWLTFHIGAPIVEDPVFANFAVISDWSAAPSLELFSKGDQDYPDQSATLIVQVESLKEGSGWELQGPGIKDRHLLAVEPLAPLFVDQWRANHALFPRGVDILFVAPDAVAGLPRTTAITALDAGNGGH